MALSSTVLSSLIKSNLISQGAVGNNLQKFCDAVATGIVNSVVGSTFTSNDSGLISNTGTGTGIGITGLSSSSMVSIALSVMTSEGSNATNLMNAIMDATVQHLSTAANLSSTDPTIYSGNGIINIGSIGVLLTTMSSNINSELLFSGANGSNRSNLALAIATGIVTNILSSGTGNLTITGSASPPMSPGTGTGTGTIS